MKKAKKTMYLVVFLMLGSFVAVPAAATIQMEETTLFIEFDTHWRHSESGDEFVARVDVTNVGEHTAYCVLIKLKDIPCGWRIWPCQHFEYALEPGETIVKYFLIERGDADATVYASARAINANEVISDSIPLPIFPGILMALSAAFGGVVYKDVKKRKKEQ